jgi:hypothetical protein
MQVLGLVVAVAWAGALSALLFKLLDKFGILHVGLDVDVGGGVDEQTELLPIHQNNTNYG